jgi:L,D-transpeptidase YcbB
MTSLKNSILKTPWCILLLLWVMLGCKPVAIVKVPVKPEIKTSVVVTKPLPMPVDLSNGAYTDLINPEAVIYFYNHRHFEIAWLKGGASALADSMVSFLRNVRFNGLLPQNYHLAELTSLPEVPLDTSLYFRKEALLTDAFLSLASDLKYGRLTLDTNQRVMDSTGSQALDSALTKKDVRAVLVSMEPKHLPFQFLKNLLREMLIKTDSADRGTLLAGCTNDSIANHRTIQCVEVNMERWRSELVDLGDQYVWINIPAYQLHVAEGGRSVLESRVIVGKTDTPTPSLTSIIRSISLYPYWYVPRKIAIEELLPSIQQDTSYLRRHNFDVLDKTGSVRNPTTLEWKRFNEDYFPFTLRQREGSMNSLGIVKFVFENPYAVFLHDTNAKGLFQTNFRALSHGCIRMENPLALARYLEPEPGKIDKLVQQKKQSTIILRKTVPIYIRYLTCEFMDGTVKCYDDIYGLDKVMIKLLYKPDNTDASRL